MKDYSIELFREKVARDLNILKTSNLKKVNLKLYNELMEMFDNLDKNISLYETKTGKVTREDLGNEWATLSAVFDFYMDTTGTKEVINYQVGEIKENLEKIVSELSQENYELILKKFNASLELYNKILSIAFKTQEVNELITRFNYQILKYKIADLILDDSHDFSIYIPFVLNDIEVLLNSNEVSNNIKDSLRMYNIDRTLILGNFVEVMRLIVLAETKKQVTDEELQVYLKSTIYKESDIQKEYHEPTKEILKKIGISPKNIKEYFQYNREEAKKILAASYINFPSFEDSDIAERVEVLIENNFQDIRYIFDALLAKGEYSYALKFKKEFKNQGIDVSYEFDCVVIAYRDTISPADLANYIISTNNEFLINYIIKNKIDVFNEDFINYIVSSNNPKLMIYLEESILNIPIGFVIRSNLSNELKKKSIKNEINKYATNKKVLPYVFDFFNEITDEDLIRFINEIIISFQDIEILWEYARRLPGNIDTNITKIINQMEESNFKEKLLNVLYNADSEYGKALITNNEKKWEYVWDERHSYSFNILESAFNKLNSFEAAYVSSRIINKDDILPFVRLYYKSRLNWEYLNDMLGTSYGKKGKEEFYKYFYLGNKELFFNTIKYFSFDFVLDMVNEYPESIIDFLKYLQGKEIIALPEFTLDIFIKYYEEKINKEGISLTERIHNTLSKSAAYYQDIPDVVEFLTYVMQTGLINNEILMYAKTMTFASNLNPLFVKAVHNTKTPFLKASFAPKLYSLSASDWNIIFLTDKEKEDIINSEDNADTKDLKMRKYYGDLLKLLPTVPENIKYRIVIEIAKSKIEEYINYIVINYPELIDILLENIDDNNLYQKIMQISLNNGGRK